MDDKRERTLYCGNISEKVTEELLYELFLQAGPLESVKIPKDKDGRKRNFAFITFKHDISVPYTVALMQGISLYGKQLRLELRTGSSDSESNPYLEAISAHKRSRTASCPGNLLNNAYPNIAFNTISPVQGYNQGMYISPHEMLKDRYPNSNLNVNHYPLDVSNNRRLSGFTGNRYPVECNSGSPYLNNTNRPPPNFQFLNSTPIPSNMNMNLHLQNLQQQQEQLRRSSGSPLRSSDHHYRNGQNKRYDPTQWKQKYKRH